MGLATALLLCSLPFSLGLFYTLSNIALNIGLMLFIPMLFITFASGIASLRKDKMGGRTLAISFCWATITAFVLPVFASIALSFFPVAFPTSASAGAMPFDSSFIGNLFTNGFNALFMENPFYTLATSTNFFLPALFLALLFGLTLKPSSDAIKPAYVTMNSFSEVMYRAARTYTIWGCISVYFTSTFFFLQLYQEQTVFVAVRFVVTISFITLALALLLIPFVYACFTGFKRNPYAILLRSLAPITFSLFSGNINAAGPIMESTARGNLGVQKRVASTAIPFYLIFSRGGSASLSVLATITLLVQVAGTLPSHSTLLLLAVTAGAVSFACSLSTGFEPIFITLCVLRILNISLYGAEMAMVALLPLLSLFSLLLDAELAMLGCDVSGRYTKTQVDIAYKDTL